jgi:hypothetical protein
MKKKKSKPIHTLTTICRVCNAALYYNDDCGCLECIICEQRNKIKNENKKSNNTMGQNQ